MPRETSTEKRICGALEAVGYELVKWGREGWPDRFICHPSFPRRHVWIEFKQEGAPLTAAQRRRIPKMTKKHEDVFIVDETTELRTLISKLSRSLAS